MKTFRDRVREVVAGIPKGKIMSYGDVAAAAGKPLAARAVGSIMHVNDDTRAVPCHRVIRTDGTIGGYNNGTPLKIRRLRAEGVRIDARGVVHPAHRIGMKHNING
ncbi:MAG: MGMT family protein [Candidatus Liptonbacteria bacterium]|nr:MGMT family protein [Candidatus Liptonbacteria bacterium]